MASQEFFYETPHVNFGLHIDYDDNDLFTELTAKAEKIDKSNRSIYRVISQLSSKQTSVQLFVAPYQRYSELASDIFEQCAWSANICIKNKNGKSTKIKDVVFLDELYKTYSSYKNNKSKCINLISDLIKKLYESDYKKLEKKVEKIAENLKMGKIKYQEYYKGLAHTWIEYNK